MSLPAPYSEVYQAGDGVTTVFSFGDNFVPISQDLVKCIIYLEDGYEVIPTYSVDIGVGTVTITTLTTPQGTVLTAPPIGSTVRIYRDEPEAQNVTASQLQAFTAKQLERALDAIVAMIQEVSYTVDHKTLRLTETQRDVALQKLKEVNDGCLVYWDFTNRKLVVTDYPQQDVVRCVNGLFFRLRTDPSTQQPYLQWSTDNSDWHSIDVDTIRTLAQSAYDLADDAYNLASTTRGELNTHKANHNNPHETSMNNLIDTNFNNLVSGQFLQFNGANWVNVNYNATVTWGSIGGNINDQADLKTALDGKVSTDGSSTMTGMLKMRTTSSFQCAIAPLWDGVGFFKLNSDDSATLISYIETNDGFVPGETNTYDIGSSLKKWKNLYLGGKLFVSAINNGGDLAVPAVSGTLATKADVDLAANSGRMITDQGLWYAKIYSATVPPSAEDGANYADFSQTDNDGNPIIVTYNRVSGAWVQDETITPPADYDGYVPITSKIWDIPEQTGQQGGRILWNHQSKEFTPYPQIVSFDGQNITNSTFSGGTITNSTFSGTATLSGVSTVNMPQDPTGDQIVNKNYVDNHIPTGNSYHPGLFAHEWDDHIRNDVQWLRADTFSWQAGSVYQAAYKHLRNDMYNWYSWENNGTTIYTKKAYPEVGEKAYSDSALTTEVGEITAVTDTLDTTVEKITVNNVVYDSVSGSSITPTTETVGGVTIQYIPAEDGHKIVTIFDESDVADIYTATGVAWYYIIDYGNKRFKLPRSKHEHYGDRPVVGNANIGFHTDQYTNAAGLQLASSGYNAQFSNIATSLNRSVNVKLHSDPTKSGVISTPVQDTDQYKYLYFYVGAFTQTALENTAGITAETLNDKVDKGHQVIEFQAPTAQNNYTWYRKYADGWVEQGGIGSTTAGSAFAATYPISMLDTNYTLLVAGSNSGSTTTSTAHGCHYTSKNTTGCSIIILAGNSGNWIAGTVNWQVSGMAQ